jgi:hypothetical protein
MGGVFESVTFRSLLANGNKARGEGTATHAKGSNKMLVTVSAWRHGQPQASTTVDQYMSDQAITQQVNGIILVIGVCMKANAISVSSASLRLSAGGNQNQLEYFALRLQRLLTSSSSSEFIIILFLFALPEAVPVAAVPGATVVLDPRRGIYSSACVESPITEPARLVVPLVPLLVPRVPPEGSTTSTFGSSSSSSSKMVAMVFFLPRVAFGIGSSPASEGVSVLLFLVRVARAVEIVGVGSGVADVWVLPVLGIGRTGISSSSESAARSFLLPLARGWVPVWVAVPTVRACDGVAMGAWL